jgi:hypothetical protein
MTLLTQYINKGKGKLKSQSLFMRPMIILISAASIFILINFVSCKQSNNNTSMTPTAIETDKEILSELNAQFIKNFINQDVKAHEQIIYKDFVCIENNGSIVNREDYMKAWATDYENSNLTSFTYTDEFIRIFGNTALVRSKTVYTKIKDGQTLSGNSVYTDTYIKEDSRWWCVQAQITPVQK